MRRVLMVLTVAALLAAMMVSAGPAQAQANEASFENSTNCVQGGDFLGCGFGDDEFGDSVGSFGFDPFDFSDGLTFFNSDDNAFGEGDSDNSLSLFCPGGCNVGHIDFPTTSFSA